VVLKNKSAGEREREKIFVKKFQEKDRRTFLKNLSGDLKK
jgi:hypothetical protein